MTTQKNTRAPDPSPDESVMHRLLRKLAKLIPETAEDVACAEEVLGHDSVALPDVLLDASAVFEGSLPSLPSRLARSFEPRVDPDVLGGFAAAAREGGAISPEVEEKMRRDWDSAREHQSKENSEEHDDRPRDRGPR